jgi:hypothetical protein
MDGRRVKNEKKLVLVCLKLLYLHPHIQLVCGAISQGTKRPGYAADQLFPASAEIKNGGAISPLFIFLRGG